jgi:hypothetical protein
MIPFRAAIHVADYRKSECPEPRDAAQRRRPGGRVLGSSLAEELAIPLAAIRGKLDDARSRAVGCMVGGDGLCAPGGQVETAAAAAAAEGREEELYATSRVVSAIQIGGYSKMLHPIPGWRLRVFRAAAAGAGEVAPPRRPPPSPPPGNRRTRLRSHHRPPALFGPSSVSP